MALELEARAKPLGGKHGEDDISLSLHFSVVQRMGMMAIDQGGHHRYEISICRQLRDVHRWWQRINITSSSPPVVAVVLINVVGHQVMRLDTRKYAHRICVHLSPVSLEQRS